MVNPLIKLKLLKSQVSVDFLIVAGIVLIIFLVILSVINERRDELFGSEKLYSAKEIADMAASGINTVFLAGNGTTKTFYVPDSLRSNSAFSLRVYPQGHIVEVAYDNGRYTAAILTSSIAGDFEIIPGQALLKNRMGTIEITANYISLCNNGNIDAGEECDGTDLNGESCTSRGYFSGILACNTDCMFDFSSCYACGNNVADGAEACDGTDLRGETCASQGYAGGALACQASCTAFDTTGCVTQLCGNNIAEGTEACDGNDLREQTCASQGYAGGALACQASCTAFDTTGCTSLTTCQQACSSIGFSSWLCRSSCTGAWKNAASAGNAYCAAQYSLPACCCR